MDMTPDQTVLLIILIGFIIGAVLFGVWLCWDYSRIDKKQEEIMRRYWDNQERMLRLMFQKENKK